MNMLLALLMTAVMPPVPRVILPDADAPAAGKPLSDAEKLAERIAKESRAAGTDLGDEKTGPDTRARQRQVKDDLDALIKLLETPPPESQSSSSSSSQSQSQSKSGSKSDSKSNSNSNSKNQPDNQSAKGGGEPMPPPMGGGKPDPKRETTPKPGEQQAGVPKPDGEKSPAAIQPGTKSGGKGSPAGLPLEESIARDFWGHLPDAPRQRMLQFFREQHLPKYRDILGDYYQSLSEKERPAGK